MEKYMLNCIVELKCVMQGESLYEIWEQIDALKLGPLRKVEITDIINFKPATDSVPND